MSPKKAADDDWLLEYQESFFSSQDDQPQILELGCGSGRDTIYLTKMGSVLATDISLLNLHECKKAAPAARLFCVDLRSRIPLRGLKFDIALASLSLHYFRWTTTSKIIKDIRRYLKPDSIFLVRLNSDKDVHFGAASEDYVEPGLVRYKGQWKRFFDEESIRELFLGWKTVSIKEKCIDRYNRPKWVWELVLKLPI